MSLEEVEPTEISLGVPTPQPSVSLAQMLKSQYLSKEFNDVFGATEVREREVITVAILFMTRFIAMIKSTTEEDLKGKEGEELRSIQERLDIKRRIMNDVNAMDFAMQDSFLYAFGLLRQSLKRQSRQEAMRISMSPRPVALAEQVSLKDKLFTKLGVSRKYREGYIEK